MSSEEFWKDDPQLFVSYRQAFMNKKKNEIEETNYKSWLQGLYIHEGNEVTRNRLSYDISRILGAKGQKPTATYLKRPIDLSDKETKDIEKEKEIKEKEYFRKYNYFATMKQNFMNKIKRGE